MTRAWTMFQSGSKIDLLNPRSDAWTDRDLAVGLSRTNRWGGHSAWDYPLSVAQHSLAVLAIREAMPGRPLTAGEALRELLHDAPEALMGGLDIITPLKPILGDAFRALDTRLQAAVNRRYDLPPWTVASHREHKQADHQAAANEALHVVGWRRPALRKTLGIEIEPMAHDPLDLPDAVAPWEPWPPYVAADRFLDKLKALQKARGGGSEGGRVSRTRRAARRCGDIRRLAAKRRHWKRARVAFRAELGRLLADLARLSIDGEVRP